MSLNSQVKNEIRLAKNLDEKDLKCLNCLVTNYCSCMNN